jgi:hypothetical protein
MDKVQLVVYALLILGAYAEKFRFDDFKLFKLTIQNEQQLEKLQMVEGESKEVKR